MLIEEWEELAPGTRKVQIGRVKRSIELDEATLAEVDQTAALVREKPSTVMRLAIRAGLPVVANRFQAPRPEGYFAKDYQNYPKERLDLERAFAKAQKGPDR